MTNRVLPPEGDPPGKADYDIEIWGWSGSPDPSYLLSIFKCDEIGVSSDSQYCNPAYDALYERQLTEAGDERKATLAEMQNIIYDEAPYDILFYDSYLDVYRNDRFAGWQNMPSEGGIPFFTYGTLELHAADRRGGTSRRRRPAAASALDGRRPVRRRDTGGVRSRRSCVERRNEHGADPRGGGGGRRRGRGRPRHGPSPELRSRRRRRRVSARTGQRLADILDNPAPASTAGAVPRPAEAPE